MLIRESARVRRWAGSRSQQASPGRVGELSLEGNVTLLSRRRVYNRQGIGAFPRRRRIAPDRPRRPRQLLLKVVLGDAPDGNFAAATLGANVGGDQALPVGRKLWHGGQIESAI